MHFTLRSESSGDVLVEIDDAPFDREGGRPLLVCQHHFAEFPPDTVAEVRARNAAGDERPPGS